MRWFGRRPDRSALAAAVPEGPVRTYLTTPPPDPTTPVGSLPALALDLETTGLDPATDHILAIGWVPLDDGAVTLAGARHTVVRTSREVGQSAAIHGLTDDAVAAGRPLTEVLEEMYAALAGRILLAHHAVIETGFLAAATQALWQVRPPFTTVDTMELQRRLTTTAWEPDPRPGSLRLWAARERYGLPVYRAHNALTDAISCAELYLAQTAELAAASSRPVTLAALGRSSPARPPAR